VKRSKKELDQIKRKIQQDNKLLQELLAERDSLAGEKEQDGTGQDQAKDPSG
jgi:hypothetical protein